MVPPFSAQYTLGTLKNVQNAVFTSGLQETGQIDSWLLTKLHWNLERLKRLNAGLDVFRYFLMWLKHSGIVQKKDIGCKQWKNVEEENCKYAQATAAGGVEKTHTSH